MREVVTSKEMALFQLPCAMTQVASPIAAPWLTGRLTDLRGAAVVFFRRDAILYRTVAGSTGRKVGGLKQRKAKDGDSNAAKYGYSCFYRADPTALTLLIARPCLV